ncbi:MAG: hypothetical protein PHV16_01310 [Candidatus Nanoarchaeia archaeon]|nr:hypothetical protein [Candidatus Nanoarchaeia archaeon]
MEFLTIDLTEELPGGPKTYNNLSGWHLANREGDNVEIICDIISSEKKKVMDISIRYCKDNAISNEECEKSSHLMKGELLMH